MAILNPWKSAASSNIEQISRIPVPLTPRLVFPRSVLRFLDPAMLPSLIAADEIRIGGI